MKTFLATSRSRRGFTLLEIMTVVVIVGILSALAVAGIRHIRDRATRSAIINNLRQYHAAKGFYFSESGTVDPVTIATLAKQGYLRPSARDRLADMHSMEAGLGWHYAASAVPFQPVYAYRGSDPVAAKGDDIIFFPAPPQDAAGLFAASAASVSGTGAGAAVTPAPVASPPSAKLPTGTFRYGSINTSGGRWNNDLGLLYQMGLHTPADRTGLSIKGIQFDDPSITATNQADGWHVTGPGVKPGADVAFTITVTNAEGETSTVRGSTRIQP